MSKELPKIIVILGPTASGKSDLAIAIAKKFNGEIISADSRQVYREMDIGTGKVPRDKNTKYKILNTRYFYQGILHHLLNVASPKYRFTVAQYKKLALAAIKKIQYQNKIPILCGGTGFYIRAITDNLAIPEVKPDLKLRAQLEKKSTAELFSKLEQFDPVRAATIDSQNPRRLIRALEIVYKTNTTVPGLKPDPQFDVLFIGVKKSPAQLKKLIHARLLKRIKQGLVREVENLRKSGVSWKRLDDFGLEYRWVAKFLQKKISREEMILRLQKDIEHYAKRQMTWFKKYPGKKVHWVSNKNQAERLIKKRLALRKTPF